MKNTKELFELVRPAFDEKLLGNYYFSASEKDEILNYCK